MIDTILIDATTVEVLEISSNRFFVSLQYINRERVEHEYTVSTVKIMDLRVFGTICSGKGWDGHVCMCNWGHHHMS